jgi:hypothetical protein
MRYSLMVLVILSRMVLAAPVAETPAAKPYFFPFVNPFEATVLPLPAAYRTELPAGIPVKEFVLKVFPERKIPDVFWYQKGLLCSLAYQDHKAPLLFIIAGTGAHYSSPNMIDLQKVFYQAGFHVINITSPTHMNFVVNASSGMPGNTPEDAKDLYRVMEMAAAYAGKRVEISGYALTGYSLGGIQSAFLSKLDEERKVFNFDRVLLINPPVNLYTSISNLDRYLTENIPGGVDNFAAWFRDVLEKLAEKAKGFERVELSGDFVYKLYKYYPPREDRLALLVGTAFRLDSGNLAFTVDVMNGGGYIVPKNVKLTSTTSLTGYAMTAYHTSFVNYFDEWFFPFYERREPGLTKEMLIQRTSLRSMEAYLKSSPKIGLLHNEDDIIMGPGEVDYLRGVFGSRACVFPTGGHCGNMIHEDAVRFMASFLTGKERAQ